MPFLRDLIPPAGLIRVLCLSNLGKTAAHGIILTVSVLFFTRSVDIPAHEVGLALTLGAAVGMCVSVPAGRTADLLGPRNTTVAFLCLLGLFVSGYVLVSEFWSLLAVSVLALSAEPAANAARGALLAALIPADERVRALSYMRSVSNLGISFGAVAGGAGLYFDTRLAYDALLLAASALFVCAGLAFLRVPQVTPVSGPDRGSPWGVLRDRPYVAVSLVNSVLITNHGILIVALPIWIVDRTNAPVSLYSGILLLNTLSVVLFQVRVSRGSEDVPGGARALRRSGVLLACCCALFALATGRSAWLAVVFLLAGAIVHVLGEMLYSAGAWSLAFGLAPEHAQGQYQGLFEMSTQLGSVITPVAATTLILGLGWPGWLFFAAILLAAGLSAQPAARWAQRTGVRVRPQVTPDPTVEPTAGI